MPSEFLISPWGGIFWLVAVMATLTFHEFLHALMAYSLGDQTPKTDGRVTLFPFPHIDPLGFVLILLFGVGWAKPVRFEPTNLRYRTFGSTMVALAGPLANAIFLIMTIAAAKFIVAVSNAPLSLNIRILLQSFIIINSLFLVTNLLPLPPFDGSKFLLDLLQKLHLQATCDFLIKNGQYILIGVLALDALVGPGIIAHLLSATISLASRFL